MLLIQQSTMNHAKATQGSDFRGRVRTCAGLRTLGRYDGMADGPKTGVIYSVPTIFTQALIPTAFVHRVLLRRPEV
jgi:hypothetical protein